MTQLSMEVDNNVKADRRSEASRVGGRRRKKSSAISFDAAVGYLSAKIFSWRRAFCTSAGADLPADVGEAGVNETEEKNSTTGPTQRSLFAGVGGWLAWSNPSTPRLALAAAVAGLRCRTKQNSDGCAELQSHSPPPVADSTALFQRKAFSTPSSPRSPARFHLFKHLSLSKCRVCWCSLRNGQGTLVFTAECSHAFHLQCISAHVKSRGVAICPVCSAKWQQPQLLCAIHHRGVLAVDMVNRNPSRITTSCDIKNGIESRVSAYKVYNDDEPLLDACNTNQGSAVLFNPIPKVANEKKDKDEAPRPSSIGLQLSIAPQAALLTEGRRRRSYAVALKVKVPPVPHPCVTRGSRSPMDLVTVLDVSQGVKGDKLQMLKRGMRLVVSSLGPVDRLSVVAFSAEAGAKRLLPLQRMSRQGQRATRQMVDRLVAVGGAGQVSVSDLLKKAAKVLEDRRERNSVATIVLLVDSKQQQRPPCSPSRTESTTTSAAANTCFAHLEIPVCGTEEPLDNNVFNKFIGGLVSMVMKDARLGLVFPSGEISAIYQCGGGRVAALQGRSADLRLGDLCTGEERELLLEVRVPVSLLAAAKGSQSSHRHLSVQCSYRDPSTQECWLGAKEILFLPSLEDPATGNSLRLRNLFVSTRAVAESRHLAGFSDYATMQGLLSSARLLVLQSDFDSQSKNQLIQNLDAELADLQRRQRKRLQQQLRKEEFGRRRRGREAPAEVRGESLTPTSAWRVAEQLAKVATVRKSMSRVGDLHGFENARF